MRVSQRFLLFFIVCCNLGSGFATSTAGVKALVKRRLPQNYNDFVFTLTQQNPSAVNFSHGAAQNDEFTVSNGQNGTIHISGNSPIALTSGLRWYLTNIVHVDIYWFIGSRLNLAPLHLPQLNSSHHGASVVPWRYHLNTVTFSYTSAFWDWEDWELQLDWMALRGVNLPLAWVGYEKILTDVFQEAGFSEDDIFTFYSGPAFQAWNRFGNIQGSWGGTLSRGWVESQFALNQQIVARMVELGMTPVLPCFTGFVPPQIDSIYPNASFVRGSQYATFPPQYSNDTFLEPFDPLFKSLQKSFISKQQAAYGNVTHIYTLDQYNENVPFSGDAQYLHNISSNTIDSLKAADPDATWLLQGWLFYIFQDFWTSDRAAAYLGAVENSDMLILDLFSESFPQWQRTKNYFGKSWIFCQLHNFGGSLGLYGQLENVTINAIEALDSPNNTMVGMGLTMEGEEGNEIMYDILLDQAWSVTPINTETYFQDWVTSRYHGAASLPDELYSAWDILRRTVYNNTDFALGFSVPKSVLELSPNTTGILGRLSYHPTTITYSPSVLIDAWETFFNASTIAPSLWASDPYLFDITDLTRQVLANAFQAQYVAFVAASNRSSPRFSNLSASLVGGRMLSLLRALDTVLLASGNAHFSLPDWIASARARANGTAADADFLEYMARNQVTLWGPQGEIIDYASKQWGGLVGSYYLPRWERFVAFTLNSTTGPDGQNEGLRQSLWDFELAWQTQTSVPNVTENGSLKETVEKMRDGWMSLLKGS